MIVTPAASAKMKSLREIRGLAKQVALRYGAYKKASHPDIAAMLSARRAHFDALLAMVDAQKAHLEAFGGAALPMYTNMGTKR